MWYKTLGITCCKILEILFWAILFVFLLVLGIINLAIFFTVLAAGIYLIIVGGFDILFNLDELFRSITER